MRAFVCAWEAWIGLGWTLRSLFVRRVVCAFGGWVGWVKRCDRSMQTNKVSPAWIHHHPHTHATPPPPTSQRTSVHRQCSSPRSWDLNHIGIGDGRGSEVGQDACIDMYIWIRRAIQLVCVYGRVVHPNLRTSLQATISPLQVFLDRGEAPQCRVTRGGGEMPAGSEACV